MKPPARSDLVTVFIPAHNERDGILDSMQSVDDQSVKVHRKVVVADNCTDGTPDIVRGRPGWELYTTTDNAHKKAGALNQALGAELPEDGYVLVMDADSVLGPDFLENALREIDRGHDAVGGVFTGRGGGGFWGFCQRNEYERYRRDVRRLRGKTLCLTGTATLFSVEILREVAGSRESKTVYDRTALTEDFELTLRLKHLGAKIAAPHDCTLTTEVMETPRDLHRQRLRWKRGAIEALTKYGLTRHTAGHWGRQMVAGIGAAVTFAYISSIIFAAVTMTATVYPIWLAVTAVFILERVVSVRARGWRVSATAALLVPEMVFDVILQATHVHAWALALTRRKPSW